MRIAVVNNQGETDHGFEVEVVEGAESQIKVHYNADLTIGIVTGEATFTILTSPMASGVVDILVAVTEVDADIHVLHHETVSDGNAAETIEVMVNHGLISVG